MGKNYMDQSAEAVEKGLKPESTYSLDESVVSGKNVDSSHLMSSIPSSDCSKEVEADQAQAKEQISCPPATSPGHFFHGDDRAYPKSGNQGYFLSEGMNVINSASYLSSCGEPSHVSNVFNHSRGVLPPSSYGHSVFFSRNNPMKSRSNGRTINNSDELSTGGNYNGHGSYEVSSQLVRGPRSNRLGRSLHSPTKMDCLNAIVRRDQINKSDFQIKYQHAKFFMIKSYSEDDIHKSIKYSVWSSTPNGNNKLDTAYRDADAKSKEKNTSYPIFLFFSVNTSGQFVGMAEMSGPVDFKKNMDFWQQDRWNGFFPVMWHIIKDIPNRLFQHITLENNDNKAVTFSRDTQEIGLPQGLRMLEIFKTYPLEKSLLDDFEFYEGREKILRAARSSKPAVPYLDIDFRESNDSLDDIEAAFKHLDVSARPNRTFATRNSPPNARRREH